MAKGKSIVIIPARGNSKRLQGKNILPFLDLPLIVHSINYAKNNLIGYDDVVVTTDDLEIKSIASNHNIKVIDRPLELAGDNSTTVSAMKHVLNNVNKSYDSVILLQPTNPLRPKDLLQQAMEIFAENKYDSLMTVSLNDKKLGKIKEGIYEPYTYYMGQRSQDIEPLYFENGLLYISKPALILSDRILGDKNFPFIVNHPFASVDIDTEEDLKYAEFIAKTYSDE